MLKYQKDLESRAARFIPELLATGKVFYYLDRAHPGQLLIVSATDDQHLDQDGDGLSVIPCWTRTYLPYARKWDAGTIVELEVSAFISELLPRLDQDRVLLGLNWDGDGCGMEVFAQRILQDERVSNLGWPRDTF